MPNGAKLADTASPTAPMTGAVAVKLVGEMARSRQARTLMPGRGACCPSIAEGFGYD